MASSIKRGRGKGAYRRAAAAAAAPATPEWLPEGATIVFAPATGVAIFRVGGNDSTLLDMIDPENSGTYAVDADGISIASGEEVVRFSDAVKDAMIGTAGTIGFKLSEYTAEPGSGAGVSLFAQQDLGGENWVTNNFVLDINNGWAEAYDQFGGSELYIAAPTGPHVLVASLSKTAGEYIMSLDGSSVQGDPDADTGTIGAQTFPLEHLWRVNFDLPSIAKLEYFWFIPSATSAADLPALAAL